MSLEETIFEQPSGNVRGTVIALIELGGKQKRVAHATLLTDRAPDVVLEVPRKVALAEIPALTSVLNEFSSRVQALTS